MLSNEKQDTFFTVKLMFKASDFVFKDEIDLDAMEKFGCSGICDFSMNEPEVDALLGERSYSGGDLPEQLIDEVVSFNLHQAAEIHYYFEGHDAQNAAINFTRYIVNLKAIEASIVEEAHKDWNAEWKKHYSPIKINQEIEVIPSFYSSYESDALKQIYIEPGQGFGTGGHETTKLCLELLTKLKSEKINSVLDFGCGSGILGIAAKIILENNHLDLVDIDLEALNNCQTNLDLNQIKPNYNLYLSTDLSKLNEKYELIFANILLPILIDYAEFLQNKLSTGGYLILSGILNEQVEALSRYYQSDNLVTLEVINLQNWSALLIKKV